jgi:hypothetical protein
MNRFDGTVINAVGEALPACQVYVCTQPASTGSIPPSPLASIFSDPAGAVPLANPVLVDGNGNFFFYAPVGVYTLVYFDPYNRIQTLVFPDQQIVTPGGGSVNSVGMTVPDGFAVAGSPVSSAGTLATSYSTDWGPGVVIIGPVSGPAAAPTRRRLTAADIAGLAGGVSSVNASVSPGALFSALFSGGPITSSGVLNLAFDFNPQTANKILAGPVSGGLGAVTARSMAPADLPPVANVAFASNAVFNGAVSDSFIMTLTGNVTAPTFVGGIAGVTYTFVIKQDSSGNHTFAWPANVIGGDTIDPTANSRNVQSFIFDGTNLLSVGPMRTQ